MGFKTRSDRVRSGRAAVCQHTSVNTAQYPPARAIVDRLHRHFAAQADAARTDVAADVAAAPDTEAIAEIGRAHV